MYNFTEEQEERLRELEEQLSSLDVEEMKETVIFLQKRIFTIEDELRIVNRQKEQIINTILSRKQKKENTDEDSN